MKKLLLILISATILLSACSNSAETTTDNSIEESIQTQIDPAEEFNGVMFGMTKEEVINVIGRQPDDSYNENLDSIIYKNEMYFGITNATVNYSFADDGGLEHIMIDFSLSESTQDGKPIDFDLLKKELFKRYPEETFTYVNDEDSSYTFQTDNRMVVLYNYYFLTDTISVAIADRAKL